MSKLFRKLGFISCFVFGTTPLFSQEAPSYMLNSFQTGFFANFCYVVAALEEYDTGKCDGIEVLFTADHMYDDPEYGPNWWEYFFEPLKVGEFKNPTQVVHGTKTGKMISDWTLRGRWHIDRNYAHSLINKYITVKDHILDEVAFFTVLNDFDKHTMIGVHYRGTDKCTARYREADPVTYVEMFGFMIDEAAKYQDYKFFVATDEERFIDEVTALFGDKVAYCTQIRSTTETGVHNMKSIPGYEKGAAALIDCLLLSHCPVVIRMSSNLSLASGLFNKDLKFINVNYPDSVLYKQ